MDEQNIENEQIQDNQTHDTVQQNYSSDTHSTELKSLDNLNTMMICQFIIFGVIVGILLSKTLWRRLTV